MSIIADRRKALLERIRDYGGPINEPAVFVQFMAQVMHESGGLRYVREIWGPTKAQARYEGRKDLGNVKAGDGKRFMGRDVIQITGRANYRALSRWAKFDFEAKPEALESPEWLGIGAIWYFLQARPKLIQYCRDGNIEMVTRQVNGGLNGYADRLRWYDDQAIKLLGFGSIKAFQQNAGLVVDGVSGPKTRAAMHKALSGVKITPSGPQLEPAATPIIPGKRTDIPAPKPTQRKAPGGAPVVAVVLSVGAALAAAATGAWNWLLGLFN
jgi:putative chitinase